MSIKNKSQLLLITVCSICGQKHYTRDCLELSRFSEHVSEEIKNQVECGGSSSFTYFSSLSRYPINLSRTCHGTRFQMGYSSSTRTMATRLLLRPKNSQKERDSVCFYYCWIVIGFLEFFKLRTSISS